MEQEKKEEEKKPEEAKVSTPEVAQPTETAPAPAAPTQTVTAAQSTLNGVFPEELNRWNWGAFFLTWIWAIGNSTWIGLLALISPISLIMAIILGIKGNEWAWNNRKFENIEQFKAVQKKWAMWGLVLFIISIVLMIAILSSSVMSGINIARDKANQASVNANSYLQQQQQQAAEEAANTNDNF